MLRLRLIFGTTYAKEAPLHVHLNNQICHINIHHTFVSLKPTSVVYLQAVSLYPVQQVSHTVKPLVDRTSHIGKATRRIKCHWTTNLRFASLTQPDDEAGRLRQAIGCRNETSEARSLSTQSRNIENIYVVSQGPYAYVPLCWCGSGRWCRGWVRVVQRSSAGSQEEVSLQWYST